MIPRFAGATLGILAFSVTIVSGLVAGLPTRTILSRSLWAMGLFCVLGLVLGWATQSAVSDHFARRRREIADAHAPGAEAHPKEREAA
jgi:hypothetical protein